MPFEIVHDHRAHGAEMLAIWRLTESVEELQALLRLRLGDVEVPPHMKTLQRKMEWMASQLLLSHAGIPAPTYLPNGKPVVEGGGISLSHSRHLVGLAVGPHPLGLDIQACVEKIFTVRAKFCSAEELSWAAQGSDALRKLTIAWSAKEAVFKYWGERVDFAGEIALEPFDCNDAILVANYAGRHGRGVFRLQHLSLYGYEVVVCGSHPFESAN